jgi:hypothetical protein
MKTFAAAQKEITAIALERLAAGKSAIVDQIDAVLCEGGESVILYLYFADDHDAETFTSFDLPVAVDEAAFDPRAIEAALSQQTCGVVLH